MPKNASQFTRLPVLAAIAVTALTTIYVAAPIARIPYGKPVVTTLLATETTIIGQKITYPKTDNAKVTAITVTMQPGQTTGWHKHDVPVFAYILEGELTVDYGRDGKRVYRTGDSFMEAQHSAHTGSNQGEKPVKLIAVHIGGQGIPNSEPMAQPAQ